MKLKLEIQVKYMCGQEIRFLKQKHKCANSLHIYIICKNQFTAKRGLVYSIGYLNFRFPVPRWSSSLAEVDYLIK